MSLPLETHVVVLSLILCVLHAPSDLLALHLTTALPSCCRWRATLTEAKRRRNSSGINDPELVESLLLNPATDASPASSPQRSSSNSTVIPLEAEAKELQSPENAKLNRRMSSGDRDRAK